MDSEECLNIGEGMRKNLRVEKTVTRFVCGDLSLPVGTMTNTISTHAVLLNAS